MIIKSRNFCDFFLFFVGVSFTESLILSKRSRDLLKWYFDI